MGCGRVGSALAVTLDSAGHSVAVVDQDQSSFAKLPAAFSGQTVKGIGFDRDTLRAAGVLRAVDLPYRRDGDFVRVGGAVICRQRPGTAKGFLFLTLEDETGLVNVIVRPDQFDRFRALLTEAPLLRIDGVCDVVNNNLDGIFQVGIAPGTLRWVPGAESKVFSRREDGFLWATMRLVGPLDSPSEDLSDRLYDAAVAATIEEAPKKVIETGAQALDAGKNAAGALLDTGSKVIEKGAEAIRGFVPFFK